MGLFFKKKKKLDLEAKARDIERNIWDLENKQILYLDKLKTCVKKQAEYKEQAKTETDKNMQRHYANLYLNCEKEKEQFAYSINEISKEIVSNAKMAQLVDTQALFVELEKMESLSLEQINTMTGSITDSREKRETMTSLRSEAIDKAMYRTKLPGQFDSADTLLQQWQGEADQEAAAEKEAAEKEAQAAAQKPVQPEPKVLLEDAESKSFTADEASAQEESDGADAEADRFLLSLKNGD